LVLFPSLPSSPPDFSKVWAQVFSQNINVARFNVSGNCLGKIGSRELLRAVRSTISSSSPIVELDSCPRMAAGDKRILRIDMDGCNVTYLDDTFDRNNASGDYHLDVCFSLPSLLL
jgi:hypothetical protein